MPETQTILVVDDRSVDRRLLEKMLEGSGYEVLEAADGLEGFEMAKRNKPDLIISDTLMPMIDGFQFLRNIKKDEKTKTIPFILYSAVYTGYADEKLALSLGANAFVQKPIETEKFLLKVEAAIQGVKARKETATKELIEEEEEYLRRYSQVVAAKLEEMVRELEATNECLQLQIVEELRVEEALHKERDGAQHYLDVAGVALIIIGADRKVSLVNKKGCEILGYEKEDEIIDKDWFDNFVPERLRDEVTGVFESLMAGEIESVEYYENPVLTKDGEERIVAWHNTVLRDEHGKIYATLCSGEDVTERRRTEDTLRKSEEKLDSMLQSIGDHMSMMDKDLNIIWANETAMKIFGNNIIGKKCYEVYHRRKEPCEPHPCLTLKTFQDGRVHEHDTQVIGQDGEIIYFHCTANVALKDNEGKPAAVIEISRDVTEQKSAEEALQKSEERYQRMVANVPGLVYQFVMHPDGSMAFPFVSESCREIFGIEPHEIRRDANILLDLIHPDDRAGFYRSVADSAKSLSPWKWEGRGIVSGEEGWFQGISRPERKVNGDILWDGLLMDITERKAVEEALLKSEKQLRETKDYLDNIIESSADAIVVVDMAGTVRSWNKAAEDYMGYAADEVIGSSNRKFFADSEEPERIMEMVLRDGTLKNYRTTVLNRDEKPVQISLSASLLKDSDGVPIGTVRVSRDITKEMELEARIKEERDNLNLIFDSMVDAIYIVSKDYEIEFMNKVLIDEFGDRVGTICYKAFHDREGPCPLCKNQEVMKGETVHWGWDSGRRDKAYDLIETPLKNIDGTISKLTLFRDITERKLAEEKLEKKVKELIKFNKMTVDRELRMVELKKRINALLKELGKEPRYRILEEINTETSE
ncbi:MAG: PAS domain S-box protein [Euryarchaeota archaeon]|nr:PAS domain S-box protein [Euryarchaeota archaeon]